eukprot:1190410-Prorocentrum_minimum.AAC.1
MVVLVDPLTRVLKGRDPEHPRAEQVRNLLEDAETFMLNRLEGGNIEWGDVHRPPPTDPDPTEIRRRGGQPSAAPEGEGGLGLDTDAVKEGV